MRFQMLLTACAALVLSLTMGEAGERLGPVKNGVGFVQVPLPPILKREIEQAPAPLPVGRWSVEYANQVTEVCEIHKDGAAVVGAPVNIGPGKAVVNGGSVLLIFEGGRVQRWTPVGKRFVVEHWFPGARFPSATPGVLGIAERAK